MRFRSIKLINHNLIYSIKGIIFVHVNKYVSQSGAKSHKDPIPINIKCFYENNIDQNCWNRLHNHYLHGSRYDITQPEKT